MRALKRVKAWHPLHEGTEKGKQKRENKKVVDHEPPKIFRRLKTLTATTDVVGFMCVVV